MVKEVIEYECEICKKKYDKESEAKDCESKGIPQLYPIGMIFSYSDNEMVFAIIKQQPQNWGHDHSYSTWACRDTSAGDNANEENFCGLESWDRIYPPNRNIPAYKRMIKALKDNKIKPIDYKQSGAKKNN